MQSAPDPEDYYSVIGVSANADEEGIRTAYRAPARQLHPDLGGSPEAMTLLNKAYEVLSDGDARRAYDSRRLDYDADEQAPFTPTSSANCSTENRQEGGYFQNIRRLVLAADCCLFLGLYFVLVAIDPEVTPKLLSVIACSWGRSRLLILRRGDSVSLH